jgi:hypothetical protein
VAIKRSKLEQIEQSKTRIVNPAEGHKERLINGLISFAIAGRAFVAFYRDFLPVAGAVPRFLGIRHAYLTVKG